MKILSQHGAFLELFKKIWITLII